MLLPDDEDAMPEAGAGWGGPVGGQFGQQWDEQQFGALQPAYQYGNPDVLPQVTSPHMFCFSNGIHASVQHCMCIRSMFTNVGHMTDKG